MSKRQREDRNEPSRRARKKRGGFWIEDCNVAGAVSTGDFTLWITRVDLSDGHLCSRTCQFARNAPEDAASLPYFPDETGQRVLRSPPVQAGFSDPECVNERSPDKDDEHFPREAIGCTNLTTKERSLEPWVAVKRAPSANAPRPRFQIVRNFSHLPNGDCGDGIRNPHPKTEVSDKYWAQRKRLFSEFDQGAELDKEGWFSVTPEVIANHIAEKMTTWYPKQSAIILDAFGGVGGNTIAFARRTEVALVICVDTNASRLRMAANNCRVYDVPKDKVIFVLGDAILVMDLYRDGVLTSETSSAVPVLGHSSIVHGYRFGGMDLLPSKLDGIFLSPPWGGTDYGTIGNRHFDLSNIHLSESVDGNHILNAAAKGLERSVGNIGFFLPRNSNGVRIGTSAYHAGFDRCILEQNMLNGKLKTITMYTHTRSDSLIL
jgi:trimethylguanosine synthase